MPFRTLIVDPSPAFRTSVQSWAEESREARVVGTAATAADALAAVERLAPDVVLVEVVLPDGGAFELVRKLKERREPPRVVMLTLATSSTLRNRAIEAGADGFVAKADFTSAVEPLLKSWLGAASTRVKTPARSTARGSRTVPDP